MRAAILLRGSDAAFAIDPAVLARIASMTNDDGLELWGGGPSGVEGLAYHVDHAFRRAVVEGRVLAYHLRLDAPGVFAPLPDEPAALPPEAVAALEAAGIRVDATGMGIGDSSGEHTSVAVG
jgi:hypothetical protein